MIVNTQGRSPAVTLSMVVLPMMLAPLASRGVPGAMGQAPSLRREPGDLLNPDHKAREGVSAMMVACALCQGIRIRRVP